MATLEPERSTSRGSGSRKGKERAILSAHPLGSDDGQPQQHQQGYDQERAEYGYETQYQEPEYLTVDQPVPRRPLSSGDSYDRRQHQHQQHQQRHYDNEQRGTYDSRGMDDPELGGVGNQQGLGVEDLSPAVGATGAYPPVSEEEAEERRIQEVCYFSFSRPPSLPPVTPTQPTSRISITKTTDLTLVLFLLYTAPLQDRRKGHGTA